MQHADALVPLATLARQLRLSKRWLRAEAAANRIPSLKAGQRRLFNVDAVRQCLADRAARNEVSHGK